MIQNAPMVFDPVSGAKNPFPNNAGEWRAMNGNYEWIYNPWSGQMRHEEDVSSDPHGFLIHDGGIDHAA